MPCDAERKKACLEDEKLCSCSLRLARKNKDMSCKFPFCVGSLRNSGLCVHTYKLQTARVLKSNGSTSIKKPAASGRLSVINSKMLFNHKQKARRSCGLFQVQYDCPQTFAICTTFIFSKAQN
jgi:hypothetical protein